MKQIIFILLLLVFSFADKVKVRDGGANVRNIWIPSAESEAVGTVNGGQIFEIFDTYADYYQVKIVRMTDHVGKSGYMWSQRVDKKAGKVIIEGVCLRSEPDKRDDTLVAKVRKGAEIIVLGEKTTWYQIRVDNRKVWIWEGAIILIKE